MPTESDSEGKLAPAEVQGDDEQLREQTRILDLAQVLVRDMENRIVRWSLGAERLYGFSKEEALGRISHELFNTHFPEPLAQIEDKLHHSGQWEGQLEHRKRDGGRLLVASQWVVHRDAAGCPVRILEANTDITARKQAEEALIASERRFRAIFDGSQDAIYILQDGVFVDANAKAIELSKRTRDELIGQPPTFILTAAEPEGNAVAKVLFAMQAALEGRPQCFEWTFVGPDDRPTAFEVRLSSFEFSGQLLLQAVLHDVTAQAAAESRIREQAEFLDKAKDAIVNRDLDGKILFWNLGAEVMYGWKSEEALGRNSGELLYLDPNKFLEVNSATLNKGEWSGKLRHVTKEGREVIVQESCTLIRDNQGRPKSILAIKTDVTEKTKIETLLMRAQRIESIGTLAGGIAHDLNNILTPIRMSVEILKQTSDDPQIREFLDTIDMSAKRGASIVRQVLSFGRGMAGERIEIQPKILLEELAAFIKQSFPKNIGLDLSIPSETWAVTGDPTQVHQILLNLCLNARDAMSQGGNLSIRVENCVLDEHFAAMHLQTKSGRYVRFEVTDTGTGMAPEIIDKIFEPFFTTKELNKGTGLGLSTVMTIVKSHGGTIDVYSEPGKGTNFKIYLPASEPTVDSTLIAVEKEDLPRGNGELILVVDDEAIILNITVRTLQAFGYRVLQAPDGARGLATYFANPGNIAVVLTDIMMPVMDGPSMINALLSVRPSTKIIAATGFSANRNKDSMPGVKHYLTKPYTAGNLLRTLRAILDER